jgi:hypothetical protein
LVVFLFFLDLILRKGNVRNIFLEKGCRTFGALHVIFALFSINWWILVISASSHKYLHDITELLLKVTLNTITLTPSHK